MRPTPRTPNSAVMRRGQKTAAAQSCAVLPAATPDFSICAQNSSSIFCRCFVQPIAPSLRSSSRLSLKQALTEARATQANPRHCRPQRAQIPGTPTNLQSGQGERPLTDPNLPRRTGEKHQPSTAQRSSPDSTEHGETEEGNRPELINSGSRSSAAREGTAHHSPRTATTRPLESPLLARAQDQTRHHGGRTPPSGRIGRRGHGAGAGGAAEAGRAVAEAEGASVRAEP